MDFIVSPITLSIYTSCKKHIVCHAFMFIHLITDGTCATLLASALNIEYNLITNGTCAALLASAVKLNITLITTRVFVPL